ncbi:hypothetical protein U1701_04285 [Sphingomonas sp. PB2P19]|uniref:hypothetical protein n=1 Tax=Sphingomonas rhamnosi TaxID=3096156 RepID=UPI002FCB5BA3
MASSKQDLFAEALNTGEDYFNASVDFIVSRFGKRVAEQNLVAAGLGSLTMAFDFHSSTMRRHTDLVEKSLDQLSSTLNDLNCKLN